MSDESERLCFDVSGLLTPKRPSRCSTIAAEVTVARVAKRAILSERCILDQESGRREEIKKREGKKK